MSVTSPIGRLKEAIRSSLLTVAPGMVKQAQRAKVRSRQLHTMHVEAELPLLPILVDPSRGAADVGAHRGLYASCLEPIVGTSQLYLFEPVPSLNRALQKMFPGAFVSDAALSGEGGQATLRIPRHGSLLKVSRATLEPAQAEPVNVDHQSIEVTRVPLDQLVAEGVIGDLGFVKIDVEGHEKEVLAGCEHVLRTHRPVMVIEIEQRHHSEPIREIVDWVCGFGYRAVIASPSAGRCLGIEEFRVNVHQSLSRQGHADYHNNFTFLPAASAEGKVTAINRALTKGL